MTAGDPLASWYAMAKAEPPAVAAAAANKIPIAGDDGRVRKTAEAWLCRLDATATLAQAKISSEAARNSNGGRLLSVSKPVALNRRSWRRERVNRSRFVVAAVV